MVHEGLRVCRRGGGGSAYTKATPGCGRGGKDDGEDGAVKHTMIHQPALGILFICAHIAYSYWSLMAANVLIRVIVVEKL